MKSSCCEELVIDLVIGDVLAGDGGHEAGSHLGRVEQSMGKCCREDWLECDDTLAMSAAWPDTEPAQRGGGFRQPVGEPAQGEGSGCVVELVKPAVAFAGACESAAATAARCRRGRRQ